jgi:hypothetical protein
MLANEVCFGRSSEVIHQLPFLRSCEDLILMSFTSRHFSYISGHNVTPNYAKIKIHNNSVYHIHLELRNTWVTAGSIYTVQ